MISILKMHLKSKWFYMRFYGEISDRFIDNANIYHSRIEEWSKPNLCNSISPFPAPSRKILLLTHHLYNYHHTMIAHAPAIEEIIIQRKKNHADVLPLPCQLPHTCLLFIHSSSSKKRTAKELGMRTS